jgi:hypothetical protein
LIAFLLLIFESARETQQVASQIAFLLLIFESARETQQVASQLHFGF